MHLLNLCTNVRNNPFNLRFTCNFETSDGDVYMSLIQGIKLNDRTWKQLHRDVEVHSEELSRNDFALSLQRLSRPSNIVHTKNILVHLTFNPLIKRISLIEAIEANCACTGLVNLLYADFSMFRHDKYNKTHVLKCNSLKLLITNFKAGRIECESIVHVISNGYDMLNSKSLII